MNIPEEENENLWLLFHSIPDGLRSWCWEHKIQARLFEHYDGGGSTGFALEFTDPAARAQVAEVFPEWKKFHFASDGMLSLGPL